ncbi:MAG: PAS domain S-box protein [Pseudomonadota bacterium]|nr:PAS domain S-box protein [Pseudomonadota bacterium]
MERDVEASAAQLRSILETVPDAMITIDEDGSIELFSAAAERLFYYSADEVAGRNVAMLMTKGDAAAHDGYLGQYGMTGQRHIIGASRRLIGKRKDGSVFPLELFVGEATTGGRRVFTGFLRDLSAREQTEARMRDLQAELIQISRVSAVGTMATALAHELNQPLTAVANYVQTSAALIAAGTEGAIDLVHEALEEAGREVMRAGAIVNRLREFVAGGELDRTIVSLRDLALQTCALGSVGARLHGITCSVEIPPDIGTVLVDRVHVQQVLLNLIRNAMDAIGENGQIVITARTEPGMIRITVEDTGYGVVVGHEEELFEPFVSSKASGMGLGLTISRTIVEAHGGQIWCEALPSGGAAFHFTLPRAEVDDD